LPVPEVSDVRSPGQLAEVEEQFQIAQTYLWLAGRYDETAFPSLDAAFDLSDTLAALVGEALDSPWLAVSEYRRERAIQQRKSRKKSRAERRRRDREFERENQTCSRRGKLTFHGSSSSSSSINDGRQRKVESGDGDQGERGGRGGKSRRKKPRKRKRGGRKRR
jgi:hypothetical protein